MHRAHWLILALGFAVAACNREPTFDERYAAAQARINATAKDIDAHVAGTAPAQDEDTAAIE